MGMPRPSTEHRKLERLAGRWSGSETMHPSQWDPAGGSAEGSNDSRLALDGLALITDYEQQRDGAVTFRGHGVMTYDAGEACYVLHWFDSMAHGVEVFRGNFDGDVLVVEHGGPGMHARLHYDLSEPDVLRSRMEMSPDGEAWAVLFDAEYRRQ